VKHSHPGFEAVTAVVKTFYSGCDPYLMDHLDDISVEALQDALTTVDGRKPAQRLLAAIAYKNGITQTELAAWHGTGRRTIYSWLKRFDTDQPLAKAATDAHRSGRTRKLSKTQQETFEQTVHESPRKVGIDAPAWTPALVQDHLEETYDVTYSLPSCRRLLKEAGLSYQQSRRAATPSETDDRDAREDEITDRTGRWTPQ